MKTFVHLPSPLRNITQEIELHPRLTLNGLFTSQNVKSPLLSVPSFISHLIAEGNWMAPKLIKPKFWRLKIWVRVERFYGRERNRSLPYLSFLTLQQPLENVKNRPRLYTTLRFWERKGNCAQGLSTAWGAEESLNEHEFPSQNYFVRWICGKASLSGKQEWTAGDTAQNKFCSRF